MVNVLLSPAAIVKSHQGLLQACKTNFWPWDLPVCAPATPWTRQRTQSQSRSQSSLLHPLSLTAAQAHNPLLRLYQQCGNNDSDGPVGCNELGDVRGCFTHPMRRRDRAAAAPPRAPVRYPPAVLCACTLRVSVPRLQQCHCGKAQARAPCAARRPLPAPPCSVARPCLRAAAITTPVLPLDARRLHAGRHTHSPWCGDRKSTGKMHAVQPCERILASSGTRASLGRSVS